MSALTKIYEELSIERAHVCTGCGSQAMLSHSHIVPRSQEKSLEAVKANITYHCSKCHEKWEHSNDRVFLKDFQVNMVYMYNNAQSFYWLRTFKMQKFWELQLKYLPENTNNAKLAPKALEILQELELTTVKISLATGIYYER